MIRELKLAATPEAFLHQLVTDPDSPGIPGSDYLYKVHTWNDTGWFDLDPCYRNTRNSWDYRINQDGLKALNRNPEKFAKMLGLDPDAILPTYAHIAGTV